LSSATRTCSPIRAGVSRPEKSSNGCSETLPAITLRSPARTGANRATQQAGVTRVEGLGLVRIGMDDHAWQQQEAFDADRRRHVAPCEVRILAVHEQHAKLVVAFPRAAASASSTAAKDAWRSSFSAAARASHSLPVGRPETRNKRSVADRHPAPSS